MKELKDIYPKLYGANVDPVEMDMRYDALVSAHEKLFGNTRDIAIFSTPGRTEIAGNHTDHNMGKVIAGSISLDTIAAVTKRDDMKVRLVSEGFTPVEVDLSDLRKREDEVDSSPSLVRGIAKAFTDRGLRIGGFDANTTTKVLRGSGLSSSAAIEVLIGTIMNSLYNDDALNPVEIAKIGQFAENVYYGKPSGLMDQIGCAYGGVVGIDFKDSKEPKIMPLSLDLGKKGYCLVIVNTRGSHADLTGDYASIPSEMKAVASFLGKANLREVNEDWFYESLSEVRRGIQNDRAVLRAMHYFEENKRVDRMLEALKNDDFPTFLSMANESGKSSAMFLQNAYSIKNPNEQGITLALALSSHILDGEGASRVHGGGFAGTIQAYVPLGKAEKYIREMDAFFGPSSSTVLTIRETKSTRIS